MRNPKQTRMCVTCRKRSHQNKLLRLQVKDNKLYLFNGSNRSFYICQECQEKQKTFISIAKRYNLQSTQIIKECVQDGKNQTNASS